MRKLILTIDVGNTSVAYGVFRGLRLVRSGHAASNGLPRLLSKLTGFRGIHPISDTVLSSVVPKKAQIIRKSISRVPGSRIWVIGGNIDVPMRNKYKHTKKLGSDRLISAYGAFKIYGAPLLLLDFGTALTCDYVSRKGVFEGGSIIPGPQVSLEILSERTALLPKLKRGQTPSFLKRGSDPLLGRDTRECMKAGLLQGYGAMADGLIERFRKRYGRGIKAIATGGFASVLAPYTSRIDVIDPHLTLKSLARLFWDERPDQAS